MKMTNLTLVNLLNVLNVYGRKKLPQKISYAITRNLMILSNDYKIYEEQLQKIFSDFDKYIEKNEDGSMKLRENGIPVVDNAVEDDFNKELSDLFNIVVDIDLYYVEQKIFDYEDSDRYDPLSAVDIINLQSILCEPEK